MKVTLDLKPFAAAWHLASGEADRARQRRRTLADDGSVTHEWTEPDRSAVRNYVMLDAAGPAPPRLVAAGKHAILEADLAAACSVAEPGRCLLLPADVRRLLTAVRKGKGPIERIVIRPEPDRVVFVSPPPRGLMVDINVRLGM